MNNSTYYFRAPQNEPVRAYSASSSERKLLVNELATHSNRRLEIPLIINGKEIYTGKTGKVVMPHNHSQTLADYHIATPKEINMAIEASLRAKEKWLKYPWVERASIMMKAAELIAGKYRYLLNATTMLCQSKTAHQAEIDAICETVDFLRFNSFFASQIFEQQPESTAGTLNRIEYRPLEGFVLAITPFNFTAIAANLTTSVALMGNTVVWKPASTSILSNYYFMKILQEAGLPDGVINFIPSSGQEISEVVLKHHELAGIHFTGSTEVFNKLWKSTSDNLNLYKGYPKLVGETGGKNFVIVHDSANIDEAVTGLIRGAFEYQGQKCSAASRAYISEKVWPELKEKMLSEMKKVKMGDISNFENFLGAVIDRKSFNTIMNYINLAKSDIDTEIIWGGNGDDSVGFFIEPTIILTSNPQFTTMKEEIFGPVLTVYIYKDKDFDQVLDLCDKTSPYSLTGAIFARDKYVIDGVIDKLRYTAGNFYINDKPTGAVVGQQPFGGGRSSGTNDKAGSHLNLLRWLNPRTIKETFCSPVDFRYPFMS
ncbi:MAG: L-glutamate gamma-semialdehyde dehydrogenase [Candidatus Cloacimonetes bacterium]|nr:L-glutamate gamma-semialdehyde dehydrogenase [Candidatus Cloacimonadota bacterium]